MKINSFEKASRQYAASGNKRAYLQQPCDSRIVAARPDLKLQLYNALAGCFRTGFGFVLLNDGAPESFDFTQTKQRFADNALPILTQHVSQKGFWFHQEAFTTRDKKGRSVIMLRLSIWREHGEPSSVRLGFLMSRAQHSYDDYIPFEPWGAAWETAPACKATETLLHDDEFVVAACRHSHGVSTQPANGPCAVAWTFSVDLRRDECETIEILVPYECGKLSADDSDTREDFQPELAFPLAQENELTALSFDGEMDKQRHRWLTKLSEATRIHVPEPIVQQVYQTLTLNNLQFLASSPDTAAYRPGQGGYCNFSMVYGWEASHFLSQMARQGYHAELTQVLDHLLTTQDKQGPEGEITDHDGCFRPHIHWMNETGAVMKIFAEYAFASGDFDRLRQDTDALLKAARWIQRQRNTTRDTLPNGERALHYGLLPKGRPHDWPINGHFLFSDTFTWSGLNRLAEAFDAAGLPDATWLREEADEYRACILSATRGSLKPHPNDPSKVWVPSDIYEDPAEAIKTTIFCGPNSLIASGILDADDELANQIEECLTAANCMSDRFAFRMRLMEDEGFRQIQMDAADGHVELFYVTLWDVPWHRLWVERGDLDKALNYFYMTLAYSTSRDLHLGQERFCPQLPWLTPWQPNASGNGRILSMILATLCFVRDNECHLLHGAPDAWFAARAPLGVAELWIGGTRLSFRLEARSGETGWRFSYTCDGPWVPDAFTIALPSNGGGRVKKRIATDGKAEGAVDL